MICFRSSPLTEPYGRTSYTAPVRTYPMVISGSNPNLFHPLLWKHSGLKEALAVGSRELCERIADTLPESWFTLCAYPAPETVPALKDAISYTIITSKKRKREYILSYTQ